MAPKQVTPFGRSCQDESLCNFCKEMQPAPSMERRASPPVWTIVGIVQSYGVGITAVV
jgi:hypothetical protein